MFYIRVNRKFYLKILRGTVFNGMEIFNNLI